MLFSDIQFQGGRCLINIKASKTDPFRSGCTVRLPAICSTLCPVRAMLEFMQYHPTRTGPLFTYADRTYLTRRRLNVLLKVALPSTVNEPVSSHSFRIGAATTAASANVPGWLIKHLGRWNSNAFQLYIRIPNSTIDSTGATLAHTMVYSKTWTPV